MNVVYDVKGEQAFEEMVAVLKAMSEEEQRKFASVFQGIVIGIQLEREGKKERKSSV